VKEKQTQDKDTITHTMDFWQARSRRALNEEDARQMVENVAGFFRILSEWAAAEAGAPGDPSPHEDRS
jgi:hypothetical protein